MSTRHKLRDARRHSKRQASALPNVRAQAERARDFRVAIGGPLQWLVVVSTVFGVLCLLLATSRNGAPLLPWMQGVMVLPGLGLIVGATALGIKHRDRMALAVASLGLAEVGGGLDYLFPGQHFRLLVLPIGAAIVWFGGWLMFTEAGADTEHRGKSVCGALVLGAGAFSYGFGWI